MDTILCDEIIEEIFHRLPRRSSGAVSLVSKRWLRLLRSSKTSLSLKFNSTLPLPLSSFLSHYPYLSSLSLTSVVHGGNPSGYGTDTLGHGNDTLGYGSDTFEYSDSLLLSVASSCGNLKRLRFSAGPFSLSSLLSLSSSCPHLSSLSLSLSRPLSLQFLLHFLSLKHLSLHFTGVGEINSGENFENLNCTFQFESLSLSGIRPGDYALNLLWRNCKNLKKLKLHSCESLGDNASFSSFLSSTSLQEIELRTCRTIIDFVLSKLAENCTSLNSLLIYDGGSREGLLQFITNCRCYLRKLDLRLPLDLDDTHLFAIAQNFTGLSTLRLQSSSLITHEGLETLSSALRNEIEELSLMNCDAMERHTGLLAALGQNLSRKLKVLDICYNDKLVDKEFVSMVVSCVNLRELKLRGCSKLSNEALGLVSRICKDLEGVDIMECCKIDEEGIENFVMNSPRLRRIEVEDCKITDGLKVFAANNLIEVGC
ncbi:hypothetical protein LguiA_019627 [Lonicera macranthoides]